MSLVDSLRYRLRVLMHPRDHEAELSEEVDFHVTLEMKLELMQVVEIRPGSGVFVRGLS